LGDSNLFLSALSVGEILKGVDRLASGRKRSAIEHWLAKVESLYEGRILPVDVHVARIWGNLGALAKEQGRPLPAVDGLIAATALAHGLTVVTRNVKDFRETGVMLLNPWPGSDGE
jgi:predicted nucleic acid-binding protein